MSITANAQITITNVNDGTNGTNGYKVLRATSSNSRNYSSATWATYGAEGHVDSWTSITNASSFVPGDTMVVSGTISDRNGIGCVLYTRVNSISGTTVNATSYSFIAGERGNPGANGTNGTNGTNGLNSYFHIKYSANANGNPMSETPNTYIGTYVDNTAADSNDYTKYTWTQFRGSQGPQGNQGIPGTNGTNGKTSYLHIAYATAADGSTGFSVSDSVNKTYIGQCTDFTLADPTTASSYSWTKIKGETGAPGANGTNGTNGTNGYKILLADTHIRNFTQAKWDTYKVGGVYCNADWVSIANASSFVVGDSIIIKGTITDRSSIDCTLYGTVTAINGTTISLTTYSLIAGERGETGAAGTNGTNGTNGLNGIDGEQGEAGTPAYVFSLKTNRNTFIKDLRDSDLSTVISVIVDVQGYTGTPTLITTFGTITNSIITVPAQTAPESITITATLEGAGTKSVTLDAIDRTVYNLYLGELGALPSYLVLEGDYFLCSSNISNTICQAGIPYEYKSGAWAEMSNSNVSKMMNCLGGILKNPTLQASTGALYGWFRSLIAKTAVIEGLTSNEAFITNLKAVDALFNNITVSGDSKFGGEITSTALKTQNSENASFTLSASGGATSQGNANSITAQAVLGSQVKNNVYNKALTLTDKTALTASGNLLGRTDFNKVMRISSVSNSSSTLASKSCSTSTTTETLSWTNSKPVPITVHISHTAKHVYARYYYTECSWELYDTMDFITNRPNNRGSKPAFPEVGDTCVTYSSATDNGDGTYNQTGYFWRYTATEESDTHTLTGNVTITNNGNTVTGSSFSVASGKALVITLHHPTIPSGEDIITDYGGSASMSWVESENYAPGILFINNAMPSFYLANLSDNITTVSNSLVINGSTVLNLPIGSATTWTFNSSYGAIYKLIRFSWANTQTGTATQFSGSPTASYNDINGASHPISNIISASYTPTSVIVIGSDSFTLTSTTYISYFNIALSIIAQPKGIYAQNLYPQQNNQFDLGGTVNGAIQYWRNAYINALTISDLIPTGNKTIGNAQNPWSSAVITTINSTTINGGTVRGAVFN